MMATEVHTGTEAPAGGGAAAGLPQFDPTWWAGEIVWFSFIFLVVFILMAKVFVPRVGGTIAEREGRIAGDIARAVALKEQAEAQAAQADAEMAQARARSQKLAADAKARAQSEAAARQAQEEAKLAENLAAAEAGIKASREAALGHVREIAAETAQAIVAKLTGQPATGTEIDAALTGRA